MRTSLFLFVPLVLILASPLGHAQDAAGLTAVRLIDANKPGVTSDVVWTRSGVHDGLIDVPLESNMSHLVHGSQGEALLLYVETAQPGSRVTVRQRSVTYLNVGEEGPHVVVPGTEGRGKWAPLQAGPDGKFQVRTPRQQRVVFNHRHFAKVLKDDPRWLKLAKQCKGPDQDGCYTVTDPEFEITVTGSDGAITRRIVRVTYPNGC